MSTPYALLSAIDRMDRAVTLKDNGRHAQYERTVTLASEYSALATGQNFEQFLVIFERRELPLEFAQRNRITVPKSSSLLAPAITQFARTSRLQNIRRELTYDGRADNPLLDAVRESMAVFYGEGGLEEWIATIYDWVSLIDPNAYAVVEFDRVDGAILPYPAVYFSPMVYETGRNNRRQLEYLIVQPDANSTSEYILYAGDYTLKYTALPDPEKDKAGYDALLDGEKVYAAAPIYQPVDVTNKAIGPKYVRELFDTKCPFVQAERLGYLPDPTTGFATCWSALEPAKAVLIDHLRTGSNFDLSKYLHVMPQKVVVQPACSAPDCNGGELPNGTTCGVCKGTGLMPVHSQPTDTVAVPMPRNLSDLPDLTKLIQYVQVELGTFEALDKNLKDLANAVYVAIFNNEVVQQQQVTPVATATQFATQRDNINNTLMPFAEHKASIYRFAVRCQAAFVSDPATFSLDKLGVVYEVPKDLNPSSLPELYLLLQSAIQADAPPFEIEQLIKDLGEQRYEGDPLGLARFRVRLSHLPFIGLAMPTLQYMNASGYVRRRDMVLITYQDSVFADLERANKEFYDMNYDARQVLIDAYVDKLIADLPAEGIGTLSMGKVVPMPVTGTPAESTPIGVAV